MYVLPKLNFVPVSSLFFKEFNRCVCTVFRAPTETGSTDVYGYEGLGVSYQLETTQSFPPAKFSWKKGSTPLQENSRIMLPENGFFYISKVEMSDAGKYYSEVWNPEFGIKYSRETISLNVQSKCALGIGITSNIQKPPIRT